MFNIHNAINGRKYISGYNEEENQMIISAYAEKAFDKIQHIFRIKILENAGLEGTYLNIIKAIMRNPQSVPS